MDKVTATLVVASIGAVVSILTLVLKFRSEWSQELRINTRKSLEPFITDLGESLHELISCSALIPKQQEAEERKKWVERAARAQTNARELRRRARYPLWGTSQGIRTLIRLPDWIQRKHLTPEEHDELLNKATILARSVDNVILQCYRKGRYPSRFEKFMVNHRSRQMRRSWEKMKDKAAERKKETQTYQRKI